MHPDRLQPNPWNSNIVSPVNEEKLDEAIRRIGFFKPIVVREIEGGYEILGGEHRWGSAKRLGLEEVPIFNVGVISDIKAKEISLADNARYGADDTLMLAALFDDIGTAEEIQTFLPFSDPDLRAIFSASDIALDDLDLEEGDTAVDEIHEPPAAKVPKTHTIMRFKVSLADAERLTRVIGSTQKTFGFIDADDLTNAGDALVHLLTAATEEAADE